MKKIILIFFLLLGILFAKENYSEMSNQELIAIIGFVKEENKESFLKELNSRIPKMNQAEKSLYEKRVIDGNTKQEQIDDEN